MKKRIVLLGLSVLLVASMVIISCKKASTTTSITNSTATATTTRTATSTTTPTITPLAVVPLGSAGNFVILPKSGISTTGTTLIVGDIGISPAAATFIMGFGLIMDASNQFPTSSLITGKVYAHGDAVPTPANMTTAISDVQTAYTNAGGRALPTATALGASTDCCYAKRQYYRKTFPIVAYLV